MTVSMKKVILVIINKKMVLQIEFPHQISYLKWIYFAIRQLTKTILSPPFETKLLLVIKVVTSIWFQSMDLSPYSIRYVVSGLLI